MENQSGEALLDLGQVGQLVIDLSIVVVAVELPGVNTVGQHGHGQAGVAVRGEGDGVFR